MGLKGSGPFFQRCMANKVLVNEDLIRGKRIQTRIHNLRPFIFDPHHIDPMEIAQQMEIGPRDCST